MVINTIYLYIFISISRRYGVVEGRFCFEGGSRCGKGEGLHVLITDQGEEITQTFELASQGKLSVKKRPLLRKMSSKFTFQWFIINVHRTLIMNLPYILNKIFCV